MRPWTPRHSGLQRDKVTHAGTEKNGPPATRIRSHRRSYPRAMPLTSAYVVRVVFRAAAVRYVSVGTGPGSRTGSGGGVRSRTIRGSARVLRVRAGRPRERLRAPRELPASAGS